MKEDFEARLKAMHARFLENFPQDEASKEEQIAAFKAMSTEEKEAKITETLTLLTDKKALLREKLSALTEAASTDNDMADKKRELTEHLEQLDKKIAVFEQKLLTVQSADNSADDAKKEKFKRQLALLELKRCKSLLSKSGSCEKIDEKIAHKKEQFRKTFS